MNNEKSSIFSVMSIDWSKYIHTTKEKKQLSKAIQQQTVGYTKFYKANVFYRTPITRKMANMKERLND